MTDNKRSEIGVELNPNRTSRIDQDKLRERIVANVPRVSIVDDAEEIAAASLDAYWKAIALAANGRPATADVVVRPTSTAEVVGLVKVASELGVPITTRGLGSGTQGGAVPDRGGIVIDLAQMDRIIEFDDVSGTVTVEPGIRGSALEEWLEARGWMFPHYPASLHLASVGGYLGAKGSGVLSTRYGKIEDMVASLQVVVPPGEVIETCSVPRHAVGPDLNQVFIGSEGTLGVVTRVTLIVRRRPASRVFASFAFGDVEAGVSAVRDMLQEGWSPSLVRLLDHAATADHLAGPLEMDVKGVKLLTAVEGPEELAAAELKGLVDRLCQAGATFEGPELANTWWDNRYRWYYPPFRPELPKIWGTADVVATYTDIMNVYHAIGEVLEEGFHEWNLRLTRHFSHWYPWGTMVYGRFHIDQPPEDVDEAIAIYEQIWRSSSQAITAVGGVINDHHGIGLKLAEDLPAQLGSSWNILERIKKAIDPEGIMNPGKMGLS